MCGLLLKCVFLVVMIHGFRILGRLAGPRWSALVLGLPSTTAIVLVICGCERGSAAATQMAESSLLGLAAAVALPLAYAQTVRLGWRLPVALAAAVTGYLVVAFTLGCLTGRRSSSAPRHRAFRHRGRLVLGWTSADCGEKPGAPRHFRHFR